MCNMFFENWTTNLNSYFGVFIFDIIKAQLFLDGRCIHHLRYSLQSVSGTISDLKNNRAYYYIILFASIIYYVLSGLSM